MLRIDELTGAGTDRHTQHCFLCVEVLGNLGATASPYASAVFALLTDAEADVRAATARALMHLGETQPQVIADVRSRGQHVDSNARPARDASAKEGAYHSPA